MGYRVRRGDQIGAQWITPELVDEIRACVLVVVVLTELNPNVFFEMGAAQAWFKPMVVLAEVGTELPFDVKDLNTVFYTASESNGQLTDSAADDCMTTLKSLAEVAAAKVKLSPFYHGLCAISSHYSLSAIYSGKRFILEVFDAGVQDVIGAMEKDYELIDEGKPEGLRGLAPVLMEHSQVFHEQSRALHKTVRVADLPPKYWSELLENLRSNGAVVPKRDAAGRSLDS